MNENKIADNQQQSPLPQQPDVFSNPAPPLTPQQFQQPTATYSIQPQPTPKKKNLLWLWITLGVVIMVSIATISTVLLAKSNADAVAKEYKASAKTYLDEVYDTAIGAGDSPSEILDDINKIKAPVLEEAFLGKLSKSYEESKKQQKTISETVSKATNIIGDIRDFEESVDDIIASTTSLINDESALSSSISYSDKTSFKTSLNAMTEDCIKLETTITNIKELSGISNHVATLKTDIVALCDSVDAIAVAYDQESSTALVAAIRTYSNKGKMYNSSYDAIKTDTQNTGNMVKEAAKPLQKLSDSL